VIEKRAFHKSGQLYYKSGHEKIQLLALQFSHDRFDALPLGLRQEDDNEKGARQTDRGKYKEAAMHSDHRHQIGKVLEKG
jgi:hypothetical protein